jgi:hypothetical protein
LIFGDAAAAELGRYRRPKWFRRKMRPALAQCENCGAPLNGPYCGQCGQPAIDYRRSFGSLLLDAADAFFNLDERFLQTFWLLLIKPWQLTNDFVAGKRVRHVHPLRVYLLASVTFFLVINFLVRNAHFQTAKVGDGEVKVISTSATAPSGNELSDEIRKEVREAARQAAKPVSPRALPSVSPVPSLGGKSASPSPKTSPSPAATGGDFLDLGKDENLTPFQRWMKTRAREKLGPSGSRGDLFLKALIQNLAPMVLCCIPLFAVVLKILFIFKRRFYIDHLIFALHTHAFVFLSTVCIIGIGFLLDWKAPGALVPVVCTFLGFAVIIQLLIAIRRVYRQNWFAVLFTFAFGSLIYGVLLAFAFLVTAAATLFLP